MKYRAKATPYDEYMFKPEVLKNIEPLTWWKSQATQLDPALIPLVKQLHAARASNAIVIFGIRLSS